MPNRNSRKIQLGVIGGLGPLASAHFLKEFYNKQLKLVDCEQDLSKIITIFDPTIPDRTAFLYQKKEAILTGIIQHYLESLISLGADEVVILCFTIHVVIKKLPEKLKRSIRSLIELTLESLLTKQGKYLLLATAATNKFKIFQSSELWDRVSSKLVLLSPHDLSLTHEYIYDIKKGRDVTSICTAIHNMQRQYGSDGWLAGCTELSLLRDQYSAMYPMSEVIDPMQCVINHYLDKCATKKQKGLNWENNLCLS